jgi:CDP-glucose 4,6-dehydratase
VSDIRKILPGSVLALVRQIRRKDYSSFMSLSDFSRLRNLNGPVLITGHTGFKGTWLTYLLAALDIPCFGASLPPEPDSMFARLERTGKIPEKFIDIRNRQEVLELVQAIKPSVIIHMAAQPLVLKSYELPVETFETNVMGTAHVLDAAFRTGSVQAIGVVTTDKVYLNENSGISFTEDSPLGGKDPYSASKVGTEQVVSAWRSIASNNNSPAVVSMRAGNVVGGGDFSANRLVPDLIRGLLFSEKVEVRNPLSTRPWQHVLDPLYGYLLQLEVTLQGKPVEALNFAPREESLSVSEVVEIFKSKAPDLQTEFISSAINFGESKFLDLNPRRAEETLGWIPKFSQREAIETTIDWWLSEGLNPTSDRRTILEVIKYLE